jgi:hypothetical protein
MNLTLDAINTIKNGAAAMTREEFVAKHTDMLDQLHAVETLADGAMSMLHDLSVAKEACERCGVSKEWLDEFNADNRLFTLCNIEMPKFFGGEQDRKEVALEGIGETLWDWIKRAWEILRKIFAWIYRAIKMFLTFLVDDRRPELTGQLDQLKKLAQYMGTLYVETKYNFRKETYDVVTSDPRLLIKLIAKLRIMISLLEGPDGKFRMDQFSKWDDDPSDVNTDNPASDVYTKLMELIFGQPFLKNDVRENGFYISSTGFQFYDAEKLDAATAFKTNPLNPEFAECMASIQSISDSMDALKNTLNKHRDAVSAYESSLRGTLESVRLAKTGQLNSPAADALKAMDTNKLNNLVVKARALLGFITGAMSYTAVLLSSYTKSRNALTVTMIKMYNEVPHMKEDLEAAAKKELEKANK